MTPSIPDYELLRLIGRGSYGDVWLARGITGIFRAVKIVWRDRFEDELPFEREFKGLKEFAAISLSQAHQLMLLHVGRNDAAGFFYYVMELADDAAAVRVIDPARYVPLTLKELRARRGRLPVAECVAHGVALARGLAGLHARGLVHRDIKPSNIVLVEGQAKLADIGLVASVSDASTYVGTAGFVPPEGPGAPSADVFALGKVLYELSTGLDRTDFPRLPADLGTRADARSLLELNEILLRACEPAAAGRYRDGGELLEDLLLLQSGRSLRRRRAVGRVVRVGVAALVIAGVVVGGVQWSRRSPSASASSVTLRNPKSIAVLPLANLSPDPANAFFADGMHDEITAQLARIRDLKVIARSSTLAYPPGKRALRRIGDELNVAHVLEGSVRREGERVRVNVELIEAQGGARVWAQIYDRPVADAIAIQAELAREIAGALHATLTAGERAQIERRHTQSQVAYDLYLRARGIAQQAFIDREPLDRAAALYEQAIAADPAFAVAHAQLALVHSTLYWYGHFDPTPERLAKMKTSVDEAVRLAPDLPETRLALGTYYYRGLRDLPKALAECRAAEAGLPNDSQLHLMIGFIERRAGRWREALAHIEQASALNPQDRAGASEYVLTLLLLRRYAPLVEFADRYTAQFPDNRSIIRNASRARYELDGDRAAYLHRFTLMPLQAQDKFGLDAAADLALLRGDYERAAELFADPRLEYLLSPGSVVRDPPALGRAMMAHILGRPDEARAHADEALAYYERTKWTPHQRAAVLTTMAQAHAFAGRVEEMRRCATEARALLAGRDAFLEIDELPLLAQAYAVLGLREEAFSLLREVMANPARMIAQEIRHDPLWAKLRYDPRFEEILRSAKVF